MHGNTWKLTAALALCLFISPWARAAEPTVITHVTDPALPGKLSVIVGYGWDSQSPEVKMQALGESSPRASEPGGTYAWQAGKGQDLKVVKNNGETLVCEFPPGKFTVMAVAAKGPSGWGEPMIVNRAKITWLSKREAAPGDLVRASGRPALMVGRALKFLSAEVGLAGGPL